MTTDMASHIDPSSPNAAELMRQSAQRHPYKRAVVCPAGRDRQGRVKYVQWTFRQLDMESDCLARGLTEAGIAKGTRTILMIRPGLDFFATIFALFKIGAVPVVVDPGMGIRRMIGCFQKSLPTAFIGIPKAHVLRMLYPKFFKSVQIWITAGQRYGWGGHTLAGLRQTPWHPFRMTPVAPEDTAAILFTTGSTGPAKGAIYTHGIFQAQIDAIQRAFAIAPDEIDLPTFPLFALFDPALGMTAVIPDMDPTRPARANPDRIVEAIVNQGVTNMFASPALLDRIGRHAEKANIRLPSLRRVVSAGAPVAAAAIERFTSVLVPPAQVHTPYGATEAVPVTTIGSDIILKETQSLSRQGYGTCVGHPIEGLDLRIIRISDSPIARWEDDLEVKDGDIGEISVSGPWVTRSYDNEASENALAKIEDGDGRIWHRMGDLGWRDKSGRIWFCGRKSHRVRTAAGDLYTIPCEAIFNEHPAVFRSALVGVGPADNQHPVICIELEDDAQSLKKADITRELLTLAAASPITDTIETVLYHRSFPVDIRHNAKIFREKLAQWATDKLPGRLSEARP